MITVDVGDLVKLAVDIETASGKPPMHVEVTVEVLAVGVMADRKVITVKRLDP